MNPLRNLPPALLLVAAGLLFAPTTLASAEEATVVYLVRHAEKAKDIPEDPRLISAGALRATELASILRDAGVDHLHSSDLLRTRRTAEPLADRLRLPLELYNPQDLPALAEKLLATQGRHLVSGHSNTTPELVRLLGGAPGEAIDEQGEYDRLYVVVIPPGGPVTTILLRYGEPYGE